MRRFVRSETSSGSSCRSIAYCFPVTQRNDSLYRMIQEERSISWDVIIPVIVKK